MKWNNVYCEDCISGMKKIKDNTVDIIIADPPYNIGKNFGNNNDSMSLSNYKLWSQKWVNEALRILKPTGTMYIYGFSEILAHISTNWSYA